MASLTYELLGFFGIDGWRFVYPQNLPNESHGFKGLRCFVDTKLVSSNHSSSSIRSKVLAILCRAGEDFRADEALDWL